MYTIKQAAARTGLSVPVIRVWERRYGVVRPERTPAGYRIYDETSISRLAAMRHLVAEEGVSVLWATHLIDEVADNDDVIVLHQGRILAHGAVTSVVRTLGVQDMRAAFTRLTQELPLQAESEAS